MATDFLEKITINLSRNHAGFNNQLASWLAVLGRKKPLALDLIASDPSFYPRLAIGLQSGHSGVGVDFLLSNGEIDSVRVENSTGMQKQSPHSYKPLGIEEVAGRFTAAGIQLAGIDHVGFNLPWFAPGIHPRILQLREQMAPVCLYHRYPSGEPWDFILPGDPDEITGHRAVDYNRIRRPKFELVSFEKASKPLIQIDLGVNLRFERFAERFPEALVDPAFRNIWIYLENPHPVDICLVINEYSEGDWSGFFNGYRL
jgi:hypothetical protein